MTSLGMLDFWIAVIGALTAAACGLLGCFLVLRRMSMMGDAISHAVLPGIAIAFILTESRDGMIMLVGAGVVGVLTAALTQWVHAWGRVETNASMGVVFTTLFAIGLILMVRGADSVDLDPGCVLYGAIESAPIDRMQVLGLLVPRAAVVMAIMLVIDVIFVLICFKELRIGAFDSALAETLGMRPKIVHYALMGLVAATSVAAFEAVGSILVVGMLIVPAATAQLLTDRLGPMLIVAMIVGVLGAVLGHVGGVVVPEALGLNDTKSAAVMILVTGLIFAIALVAAPRYGIMSRYLGRVLLGLQILREDVSGFLYRVEELQGVAISTRCAAIADAIGARRWMTSLALRGLVRRGRIEPIEGGYRLTPSGRVDARGLVRTHRLWESYLQQHMEVPADHLHGPAMQLEHVTDEQMQRRLAEATRRPRFDPHGRQVPETGGESENS